MVEIKPVSLNTCLADAQQQGADTLVTLGGLQSNHARQTAAAAAKFGFSCELVLEDVTGTPKTDYYNNGNVLLDHLLGANIHSVAIDEDADDILQSLLEQLKNDGRKPYLIPVGGSNEVGSLGYVRCANEILQQLNEQKVAIDQIVVATGSAGTQAGLLAGLIAAGSDIPVLGIAVSRSTEEQQKLVEELLRKTLLKLGLDQELANNRVIANGDYYGEGYGIPTAAMIEAVKELRPTRRLIIRPRLYRKSHVGLHRFV